MLRNAANPTLEAIAQDLFDEEWSRMAGAVGRYRLITATDRESCSLDWLLPELCQLVVETRHQPIEQVEPMIRQLIAEQEFVDESGDPIADTCRAEAAELYMVVFVRLVERLRQQVCDHGAWSELPVTPQMFG